MNSVEIRKAREEAVKRSEDLAAKIDAGELASEEGDKQIDAALAEIADYDAQLDAAEAREAKLASIRVRTDRVSKPASSPHINMGEQRGEYDVYKAIREAYSGNLTGLEAEVQQEMVRERAALGRETRGLVIPLTATTRAAVTTTTGAGAISTSIGTIYDALSSNMILDRLGVQIKRFDGPTKLPTVDAATSYWVSENTAPTDGGSQIKEVLLTPHTAAAKAKISRQMLISSNYDVQSIVVNTLVNAVAAKIQQGFFVGTGASGQPEGLFTKDNTDGIYVADTTTNGMALTRAKLLEMIAAVANSNAGDGKFATNAKVTGKLEATVLESGYPLYVFNPVVNQILGRPVETTDSIPSNITKGSTANTSLIAYGVWEHAVLALFSGLDIYFGDVDDTGGVEVRVFQDADMGLIHPAAFAIANGIITV